MDDHRPRLRLKRRLTPAQFKALCEQLHHTYPSCWCQPGPQMWVWVQVAYNGNTVLITLRWEYVLEANVASTVLQLIDALTN